MVSWVIERLEYDIHYVLKEIIKSQLLDFIFGIIQLTTRQRGVLRMDNIGQ